jgi:tetratricopeptide (TPR) repeat protein
LLRAHIYNEMASIHLNDHDYKECILKISLSLQQIQPVVQPDPSSEEFERKFLNNMLKQRVLPTPGIITPLMLLLKCAVECDSLNDFVMLLFDVLMFSLEFTFGPQHPSYAEVFNQMARLFVKRNRPDDAREMYQSQIICLLQTVGQNHRLLAEAYLQLANFLGKDQSIVHYEKAYLIFESIYGINSN